MREPLCLAVLCSLALHRLDAGPADKRPMTTRRYWHIHSGYATVISGRKAVTMIEKMAQAMYPKGHYKDPWVSEGIARLALKALREPTEEMLAAARKEGCFDLFTYQAMIDAAIAEPHAEAQD